MSRGEPTDVITMTTSKPNLSDFPEELICAIIHEVDGTDIDSSWRQWMVQLKYCALVARKWRRGAQQLIHRVVCIDDETIDPVEFLKLYSNDRTAIKNEQARSSNGQLWRFPRILIIQSAPPQGFNSWLEIPEFQAFAEQCAKNVTRLDVAWKRHEVHQLDDILQYILRFPAVKSSKVDCWWRLASSAPCKRPVPRQLERMELQHTIGDCLPSICEMHAFAAWLQGSDVKVSLDYDFPILNHEWSHCNVLNTIGANIQELSLHGWLAKMPFRQLTAETSAADIRKLPTLTHCTQLEKIAFYGTSFLFPDYVIPTISSIASRVLKTILISIRLDEMSKPDLVFLSGMVVLGNLLSRKDTFPTLERVVFFFHPPSEEDRSYPVKTETLETFLENELEVLMQGGDVELEVEWKFFD